MNEPENLIEVDETNKLMKPDGNEMSDEEFTAYLKSKPAFAAHIPGTIHTLSDESQYKVNAQGSWIKIRDGIRGKQRRKLKQIS